jgi:segregation and condensation protein B
MNESAEFPDHGKLDSAPVPEQVAESVDDPVDEPEIGGEGWSGADIEEAYLKALHAMEDVPPEDDITTEGSDPPSSGPAASELGLAAGSAADNLASAATSPTEQPASEPATSDPGTGSPPAALAVEAQPAANAPAGVRLAKGTDRPQSGGLDQNSNVAPVQVIEAALFVGGAPLTARKIGGMVRGSFDTAFVEQTLDELNAAYLAQGRPYEIRLGEGGYRLELRPEYDRLRHRVYGSGPREVRLAQDVLEVLALVAYLQPISQKEIESHGKDNAGNLIRQLLRRDLISFERGPGGRKDLQYQTTPRFLSVFGLASLDDLPKAEDLAKK